MSSLRERSLGAGPRDPLWPASLFLNDSNKDLETSLTSFIPDLEPEGNQFPGA